MYGFPTDLDLSPIVGEFTTQIQVGQFDLQFTLGEFHFIAETNLELWRGSDLVGAWKQSEWLPASFYDLMNSAVTSYEITRSGLSLSFENGLVAVIRDDSDRYESAQIVHRVEPPRVYVV